MEDPDYCCRRRLPHYRQNGATYFVTWRLSNGTRLLSEAERDVVAETLCHFDGDRFTLLAYVVMDDHVHCIVEPIGVHELDSVVHSWKSYSAHRLQKEHGRIGAIWQHESYDHVIRNECEMLELEMYVWNNPDKRWGDLTCYPWRKAVGLEPE